MTHDFKGALERHNSHKLRVAGNGCGYGHYVGEINELDHKTIQAALRIADRLQSGEIEKALEYIKAFVRCSHENGNHKESINNDLLNYIADLERAALQPAQIPRKTA